MNEYEPLKGFEKLYAINREGSVWSYFYKKELIPVLNYRYYVVCLTKNKIRKNYTLHKLLAIQFLPNPDNLPHIDHINRIKTDNRLENLRWVNPRQNANNRTSKSEHPLISITP
jgi:hypothetical protein